MKIHMMAVGGTGMGSLAGLLKAMGHEVGGCDRTLYPPMSDYVRRYGVAVSQGYSPRHLDDAPDLVIIGNAIYRDNPEVQSVLERGLAFQSMAEAIRRFALKDRRSLVVAGTHGKTTTTALCGYLLNKAAMRPNMIVGGIARDFDASFLWGGGSWTVLEGDEYETAFFDHSPKFLHYEPSILILNNLETDHLDNFSGLADLERAFRRLLGEIRPGGLVLAGIESDSVRGLAQEYGGKMLSFGLAGNEDYTARHIAFSRSGTRFTLHRGGAKIGEFKSPLYGEHNLRNAVAALAACLEAGARAADLAAALPGFSGVKRRQERVAEVRGITVVDDFAHHPTAVAETLKALRQQYGPERVIACFEPRSYTCRTRQHQEVLPSAFSGADTVLTGPLKRLAGDPPQGHLDLEKFADDLKRNGKQAETFKNYDDYLPWLEQRVRRGDLVVFFSSGSFGDLPARFSERLTAGRLCGESGMVK